MNKEIREFSESIFFGLSLRQFIFSLFAVGVAVGLYFLLRNLVGTEEIGWMCIVGAAPFAAVGFFKYQNLPLERFVLCWVRSEFVYPRKLSFIGENQLLHALQHSMNENKKKGGNNHVSHHKKRTQGK